MDKQTSNSNSKIPGNTYITILPVQYTNAPVRKNSSHISTLERTCESSPFSNIILTFFNLAHIICFSPFKIKQGINHKFYVSRWLPQQIICLIAMLSSVGYRISEAVVEFPQDNLDWNPVLYFRLFHRLINLIFNLNIWISLWLMKERYLQIVEFSYTRMISKSLQRMNWRSSRVIMCIGIINTILITVYFLNGTDIFAKSQFDPVGIFKCVAAHAKSYSFCIERSSCNGTEDFPIHRMSAIDIILTIVALVSRYLRRIMGLSEELLVLVGPLTLLVAVKDFVSTVLDDDKASGNTIDAQSWSEISNKYKDLLEYTDLVNRTFGPIILTYTLTALLYFSINLDEFLTADHDTLVKSKFLVYYVLIISTFTISAEISRQIGKMTPWISKNLQDSLSEMSQRELTVILHEISCNRVGMSACGLFTLTYSVVAQMTGVIVTYFIITVQYRDQK